MLDEEVVPTHEQVPRRALGDVVVDVVGLDEHPPVLAGEQVGGAVREERGHRERRGEVGAGRGRLAVDVLVGGDDHGPVPASARAQVTIARASRA